MPRVMVSTAWLSAVSSPSDKVTCEMKKLTEWKRIDTQLRQRKRRQNSHTERLPKSIAELRTIYGSC